MNESEQMSSCPLHFSVAPSCRSRDFKYREITNTFGIMGYWLRAHEGGRNNCFSTIQLVGQKYQNKTTLASKTQLSRHYFGFQSRRFSLLVVKFYSSSKNRQMLRMSEQEQ